MGRLLRDVADHAPQKGDGAFILGKQDADGITRLAEEIMELDIRLGEAFDRVLAEVDAARAAAAASSPGS